jgi:multiple sugar transport system substrate-binding protein
MKAIRFSLAILCLCILASVCIGYGNAAPITVNALLEGHPSSTALKQLQKEFEKDTGINLNLEVIPYNELPQKALLGFSQQSDRYDVIFNDRVYMSGYVQNNYILPLDDFIQDEKLNTYCDLDDFVEQYLNACKYKGKIYGLPVYGESTFLMYRKDLFAKYNIKAPRTFDQLVAAAQKVKKQSKGKIYGITLRGQSGIHAVYIWAGFLWGCGGRWFDENGKLDIATPEAIKATEYYVDLLKNYGPPGFSNFGWQENRLAFQQGKAAMTFDATVNGAFCENPKESSIVGKVGYIPVPKNTGKHYGGQSSLAVHGLYISKFSRNPKAAFTFAAWATSKAIQTKSFNIEPNCGISSKGAMAAEKFAQKYGSFKEGMLTAIKDGNVDYLPSVPQASEIIERVGTALSQCLAGTRTPKDALTRVNREINLNVLKK